MFITKKHLSRRTVLRGMGVSLALPFLDSMVPAQTPICEDGRGSAAAAVLHRNGARRGRQHGGRLEQALLVARKGRRGFRIHPDAGAARRRFATT